MRSLRTSGSGGRAPGNRCLYPEGDGGQRPLHSHCLPRLTRRRTRQLHLPWRPSSLSLAVLHAGERRDLRRHRSRIQLYALAVPIRYVPEAAGAPWCHRA
jgi:hypothetical protein